MGMEHRPWISETGKTGETGETGETRFVNYIYPTSRLARHLVSQRKALSANL
jgi:hypothetical protein